MRTKSGYSTAQVKKNIRFVKSLMSFNTTQNNDDINPIFLIMRSKYKNILIMLKICFISESLHILYTTFHKDVSTPKDRV